MSIEVIQSYVKRKWVPTLKGHGRVELVGSVEDGAYQVSNDLQRERNAKCYRGDILLQVSNYYFVA